MSIYKTQKITAILGIILILILAIFLATRYESPNIKVVTHTISNKFSIYTSNSCKIIVPYIGKGNYTSQKHHYNPSPNIPCDVGKDKNCSAVFTINGKRTEYSE